MRHRATTVLAALLFKTAALALVLSHGIRRHHLAELLGEPLTDEPEPPAPARSGRSMPPVAAGFSP